MRAFDRSLECFSCAVTCAEKSPCPVIPRPDACRFGDLVTHFQVKKWIRDEPTQDAADVMTEIMSGEGAIQSANSVSTDLEMVTVTVTSISMSMSLLSMWMKVFLICHKLSTALTIWITAGSLDPVVCCSSNHNKMSRLLSAY